MMASVENYIHLHTEECSIDSSDCTIKISFVYPQQSPYRHDGPTE